MMLAAAWIAPMDRPPLRDGAVVFRDGRILAAGEARPLRRAHPDAMIEDLGDAIILPGLINAHTHLELSGCDCGESPSSFADWILGMRDRVRARSQDLEEIARHAIRTGVRQCLRFGVTCVGDISQHNHLTRPLVRESPLRCVSYGETIGLAAARLRYEELLERALDESQATLRLRIGLAPHAPYTVDLPGYRECIELARQRGLPLATHLAETLDEEPFLRDHTGPFQEIWQQLGSWQEPVETYRGGPIEFAAAVGLLDHPTLLAHVNYCGEDDLGRLARGRASVVHCPRTHGYFGRPPHRWREMLAAGINVAAGTDSCASSPDLNLADDLRLLHRIAPEVPPQTLWEMATIRAARAMQWADEIGSLTPGKAADVTAFPAGDDDPLLALLEAPCLPLQTWIAGRRCG